MSGLRNGRGRDHPWRAGTFLDCPAQPGCSRQISKRRVRAGIGKIIRNCARIAQAAPCQKPAGKPVRSLVFELDTGPIIQSGSLCTFTCAQRYPGVIGQRGNHREPRERAGAMGRPRLGREDQRRDPRGVPAPRGPGEGRGCLQPARGAGAPGRDEQGPCPDRGAPGTARPGDRGKPDARGAGQAEHRPIARGPCEAPGIADGRFTGHRVSNVPVHQSKDPVPRVRPCAQANDSRQLQCRGLCMYLREMRERSGDPGTTRTPNILIRSQVLYPVELRGRDPSDNGSENGSQVLPIFLPFCFHYFIRPKSRRVGVKCDFRLSFGVAWPPVAPRSSRASF